MIVQEFGKRIDPGLSTSSRFTRILDPVSKYFTSPCVLISARSLAVFVNFGGYRTSFPQSRYKAIVFLVCPTPRINGNGCGAGSE